MNEQLDVTWAIGGHLQNGATQIAGTHAETDIDTLGGEALFPLRHRSCELLHRRVEEQRHLRVTAAHTGADLHAAARSQGTYSVRAGGSTYGLGSNDTLRGVRFWRQVG